MKLSAVQQAAVLADQSTFIFGPAGTGKSTALEQRLLTLLSKGEPAYTILIITAEPEHVDRFVKTVRESGQDSWRGPYSELAIDTYANLARQMVSLFWPLVARPAGFEKPYHPPVFLSYDQVQLLMWRIVKPALEKGAFADLRLRPQHLVSQLIDTLNRAALNTLTLEQAKDRQLNTWSGDRAHVQHLEDAAAIAGEFRRFCLANNVLDFSLTVQVFDTQLVKHSEFRRYFSERYRHLIIDNVEEQTPSGQSFISDLMDSVQTATIAYDTGGGYKRFLASDPQGALTLKQRCRNSIEYVHSYTVSQSLNHLSDLVENFLLRTKHIHPEARMAVYGQVSGRFRREMVTNLANSLLNIIRDGGRTDEIAIVAPYLDGALIYLLTRALREAELPYYLFRRRSRPRDEPRVRAWLTWLALAHPAWGIHPDPYDVSEALTLSINGLDPARALLLTDELYVAEGPSLKSISELPGPIADRVGKDLTAIVGELSLWLVNEGGDRHPIDIFLHRLFHDLLARAPFQPKPDVVGAAVCDWLVRSSERLRRASEAMGLSTPSQIGDAFVNGIYQGLVTANPPDLGNPPDPNGIMISTVYGYLLAGKPVEFQVWLEASATGWWDIPRQRLSNTFVLAQSWPAGKAWTAAEDYSTRNQLLRNIIRGLTSRCKTGIILAHSDLDRRGVRQEGPLWRALQPVILEGG